MSETYCPCGIVSTSPVGYSRRVQTPQAAAPAEDPSNTRAASPDSRAYRAAIECTTGLALARPRIATEPPLPPPVILAPNTPDVGPARRASVRSASVPSDPSPQAE